MKDWLTQDPASPFTNALAVFRHNEAGYVSLQNDVLRTVTAAGASEARVTGADHLAEIFESVFELEVPQPELVWDKVKATALSAAA